MRLDYSRTLLKESWLYEYTEADDGKRGFFFTFGAFFFFNPPDFLLQTRVTLTL